MDFMKKTAGRRSGNFSDSNSPCLKTLCSVKFPQFHDMLNKSERYRVTANGLLSLFPKREKNGSVLAGGTILLHRQEIC